MQKSEIPKEVALAYNAMLRLLSRREYSSLELKQKLYQKYTKEAVDSALQICQERNYQSDKRYAEMLLNHIKNSLYGPIKFQADGIKKGLTSDLIKESVLYIDWQTIAFEALVKKYKDKELDFTDKQKALAYLARRGFLRNHCYEALAQFCDRSNKTRV